MANKEIHEASSSASRRWSYDVFLSFRGADTRSGFTDFLYTTLIDAGINVFRDANELHVGKPIDPELFEAIEVSRISVIVFSRNYAGAKWCLRELAKIMECRQTDRQQVLPIFYKVDPSDVRKQTGSFGRAFGKHEERFRMEDVSKWRDALSEAGNLSGYHFTDGYEGDFVKKITQDIFDRLSNNTYLNLPLHEVGLNSHLEKLISLLSIEANDVRIIGICAMGGMGKTTIAKAVYNKLFRGFDGSSFLENVRETSKQPNGQVSLQEKLLSHILKSKMIKVDSVARGVSLIRERLCNKRVLVVLDDVNHSDQLRDLAINRDWFHLGSRIIITTRDMQLLEPIEVNDKYMVQQLDDDESLELFSWHAFKKGHPEKDFVELSNEVVGYCKGLPLALEVLGSYLLRRTLPEWRSALDNLKCSPHDEILKKLLVSVDALDGSKKLDIFLDIACFFIGVDQDYVVKILDGCGLFATDGIGVLKRKCLLTINEDNKLMMHDMLRDMGREIVRQESDKEPGNRSRLWIHEDVDDVLNNDMGTKAVEGLILKLPTLNEEQHYRLEVFAKMHNLRLLQLNYVNLTGGYHNLSRKLRWICWHGFPKEFMPNSFHVENLVAIDMQYSNLRQVWEGNKVLEKLKVLNLSHSHYLAKTPDFSQCPNLEELILKDCTSLEEIHPSIGNLSQLVLLDMRDCIQLKNLPTSFCMLKSLASLDLSGCSKLGKSPEDIGEMEALPHGTAISQVPSSTALFRFLVSPWKILKSITLSRALTIPTLWNCNPRDETIPNYLYSLPSLKSLALQGNNFHSLPSGINNLSKLEKLDLSFSTRLQSLPDLPISLGFLWVDGCRSLERISGLSRIDGTPHMHLSFKNCPKLVELDEFTSMTSATIELPASFIVGNCNCLYGNEIPSWFKHQSMGPVSFQVPPNSIRDEWSKLAVCVVCAYGESRGLDREYKDVMWVGHYAHLRMEGGDHVEVVIEAGDGIIVKKEGRDQVEVVIEAVDGIIVKKCGVHLCSRPPHKTFWSNNWDDLYNLGREDNYDGDYDASLIPEGDDDYHDASETLGTDDDNDSDDDNSALVTPGDDVDHCDNALATLENASGITERMSGGLKINIGSLTGVYYHDFSVDSALKIGVTLKIRVTPMRQPSVNSPPSYRAMSACVKKAWRERESIESLSGNFMVPYPEKKKRRKY